jgi:serine/threonine protein kinase
VSEPGLRELFDEAAALPVAVRADFLATRCRDPEQRAQLERLLAAAGRPDDHWRARDPVVWLQSMHAEEEAAESLVGRRLGPYEVEALVGAGGSAVVYRARRRVAEVDQLVALKVLRHGIAAANARQQFDREREALSRLMHPNIARLIDAGITSRGEAWIALEYIEGMQLLDYVQARRLGPRDCIALALRIARVVAAAHRVLVVHRDLKPGNVLVTPDGEIKLLDFGIAKLIAPEDGGGTDTLTQFRAFTPAYAAPEQRDGGAVTTATDVYSLGVLLEEMLTGRRGAHVPATEPGTMRVPEPFRNPRSTLRGDIGTILQKATAEEPEQRYEGAAAFGDDLQRLLDGLPVHAYPPSRIYLLRKFVARHRGGVAVAAGLSLGVLVSLSMALWQAGVARQEAARARAVSDFLLGLFRSAEDRLPRDQRPTPEQLVASARESLAGDANLDPATRADVALTLAEVSRLGARYEDAATLLDDARRQLSGLSRDDPRMRAVALAEARVQQHAGRDRDALESIARLAPDIRDPITLRLEALAIEAKAAHALGEHGRALAASVRRHDLAVQELGERDPESVRALLAHGVMLVAAERFQDALARLEAGLDLWRVLGLKLDRDYMAAATAQAGALEGMSRLEDALSHSSRLLALQRTIYSEPHDVIAHTLRGHARILHGAGRTDEAIATHQASIRMLEQVLGDSHRDLVGGYTALGVSLAGTARIEDAEKAYRHAIALCEHQTQPSVACARARANLGMALYRQRRFPEAEHEISSALQRYREIHGETHLNIAVSLSMLANVAAADGRSPRAVEYSRRALAIMDAIGMGDTRDALLMRNSLAAALWMADDNADALVEIDRAIEGFDRIQPGQTVRRTMMRVQRAQILLDLKRPDDARAAAEAAVALDAPPSELPAFTRGLLRELTGRADLYRELDPAP